MRSSSPSFPDTELAAEIGALVIVHVGQVALHSRVDDDIPPRQALMHRENL